MILKNEVGNMYSRLAVIEYAFTKHGQACWRCSCICGSEIIVSGSKLGRGDTKKLWVFANREDFRK